jgi:hypothetical protein
LDRAERITKVTSTCSRGGDPRVTLLTRNPPEEDFRDLWIIDFDDLGRCAAVEEWPFIPGRRDWFAAGPGSATEIAY